MLNRESSHSSFDFKVTRAQGEIAHAVKVCDSTPTGGSTPVGYFNTSCNPYGKKEDSWLTETKTRSQWEFMKKGAVDGTQRRNNDKRRMRRRQLPGDGYVWETDTSPGM